MKNEFVLAFNEVLEEKQLPKEIIVKALESAMVSAYRRAVNASNAQEVEAKIDLETGKVTIFAEKEVVEAVEDVRTECALPEARRYIPDAELGSMVLVESTPRDFGRVAAQTARQVIQQRIRDAERQAQLTFFEKQLGETVSGIVQAVNSQGLTIGLEMRAEGNMPRKEMIGGERFRIHDRVRALISEVKNSPRGPQIILSRTHRNFLRRLLENEVPEIYHGIVEVRSIAREPGERAKVAVSATQPGIDPVGACVGIRGVRIQAIVRELHDEKIDVIEWNPDQALYIAKALSPARVLGVYLNDKTTGGKTATVVVPEDQLSLAIGRDGQNARLAAKLTGWRIDIKSLPEAAGDALDHLQSDPAYASIVEAEESNMEMVAGLLARKAENRMLTPEEYDRMTQFVDRVERKASAKRVPEKVVEDSRTLEIHAAMAAEDLARNLLDSTLPEHVAYTLQEAGYPTVGDLVTQMVIEPDQILKLQGIGPRAMQEITRLVESVYHPAAAEEAVETAAGEETAVAEALAVETVGEEQPEAVALETGESVEMAAPAEATAELAEATAEAVEALAEPTAAAESVETPTAEAPVAEAQVEEEEPTFDELFALKPDIIPVVTDEEEEDESGDKKGKKKSKKKRSFTKIEYDPDADVTVVRKQHKLGDGTFEWEE